jgi:GTPase SAR1 family protein
VLEKVRISSSVLVWSIATNTFLSHQWAPEVLHFCLGVPILLVGLKKDLRYDPKTISELQKSGQRPVSPEEVSIAPARGASCNPSVISALDQRSKIYLCRLKRFARSSMLSCTSNALLRLTTASMKCLRLPRDSRFLHAVEKGIDVLFYRAV